MKRYLTLASEGDSQTDDAAGYTTVVVGDNHKIKTSVSYAGAWNGICRKRGGWQVGTILLPLIRQRWSASRCNSETCIAALQHVLALWLRCDVNWNPHSQGRCTADYAGKDVGNYDGIVTTVLRRHS